MSMSYNCTKLITVVVYIVADYTKCNWRGSVMINGCKICGIGRRSDQFIELIINQSEIALIPRVFFGK